MRLSARILLFAICLLLSAFIAQPALAQSTELTPSSNLHLWTQNVMIEVMAALHCQLMGIDPLNPTQNCLGTAPQTGSPQPIGGAVGFVGEMIGHLYNPPIHSVEYFQHLATNFGLIKSAYAQGVGYQGLSPVMNLWMAFRNVVYVLFTVVFTIIGLFIMFRVKVDPRTVMTIGNTIPQILIGVIAVTFSFVISGLLIDLMYVSIYLVIGIFSQVDPSIAGDIAKITQASSPLDAADIVGKAGGWGGLGGLVGTPADAVADIAARVFDNPWGRAFFGLLGTIIGAGLGSTKVLSSAFHGIPIIGPFMGQIIGAGITAVFATQIAEFLTKVIASLIIGAAVLYALMRLWFALITAYVSILIDVVLAPFYIIFGILPGSPINFGSWLRDMLANLSAFPVTIVMFLLGRVFINNFGSTPLGGQFIPPLIGNPGSPNVIGTLIGMGIILMTPQVVTIMRDILKAEAFKYTAAIGQAFSAGTGAPGALVEAPLGGLAKIGYAQSGLALLGKMGLPLPKFLKPST